MLMIQIKFSIKRSDVKVENIKEEILKCIEELNLREEIELNDIPNLDLYMDQVITLFENGLKSSKRGEDYKLLTKTMINNYTKDKILMPTKNKKYSRNHIIMMILLYNLKQSLSINDIKILLSRMVKGFEGSKEKSIELTKLYEDFLHIKQLEVDDFKNEVSRKLELILLNTSDFSEDKVDHIEYEKLFLMVITLINGANIQRRLAEKLIDEYFTK
jgi:hypothetical protein